MRCWLLRSWVRRGHVEVEQVVEGEGRVEDGQTLAETGQELPLDLVQRLLLHAQDVQ